MTQRFLLLSILAGASLLPGCLRAAEPPAPEEWHRLLLNGQPAGYHHEVRAQGPEGNRITRTRQKLVVRRAEQAVPMEVSQEIEETSAGKVVRFRTVMRMAEDDQVVEGVVRGDRMEVRSGGPDDPRLSTAPFDPGAVGPRRLKEILREKLLRPGDAASAVTFFPEKNGCGTITVARGPEEEVEFPGGARRLVRRTSRTDALPGVEMTEWVDAAGEVWKTSTSLLGMSVATYRSTAEEVLREKYASPPEVFYASSVRPDRPLRGDPRRLKEVVYRFSLREGDFASRGISGMFRSTGQTVEAEEGPGSRRVRVGRVAPGRRVERPVPAPAGMEASLAPNSFIQSDAAEIQAIAREAVGSEKDAHRAAQLLETWVRKNVRFKDLKTAFASAREVARKREGDCTEHGVLLAALARAAGIPARVVSGLVWHEGAFVGHLWTEVHLDRWIPLDGTRGYGEVGPDHIALTVSTLENATASDLFLDLAQVIGNLRIEVLEER